MLAAAASSTTAGAATAPRTIGFGFGSKLVEMEYR